MHALKSVPNSPDAKLSLGISQLQQGTYASAAKATLTLGHIQQKSDGNLRQAVYSTVHVCRGFAAILSVPRKY